MIKVIFLDIDGVLNIQPQQGYEDSCLFPYHLQFQPKAISNLKRLLKQSQAKLVISSTWGRQMDLKAIALVLASHGIQGPYVFPQDLGLPPASNYDLMRGESSIRGSAVTPKKMSSEKCHEISWYLGNYAQYIESYVVLDDMPITWQEERQVLINPSLGLTNIKEALLILKKPCNFNIKKS